MEKTGTTRLRREEIEVCSSPLFPSVLEPSSLLLHVENKDNLYVQPCFFVRCI